MVDPSGGTHKSECITSFSARSAALVALARRDPEPGRYIFLVYKSRRGMDAASPSIQERISVELR